MKTDTIPDPPRPQNTTNSARDRTDILELLITSHTCRLIDAWIEIYRAAEGVERRAAGAKIRDLVRIHPALLDRVPDDVWSAVYRVRAQGTIAP